MSEDIRSYRDFWPYYLREHRSRLSRGLHYLGTASALLALAAAVDTGLWWLLLVVPVAGYAPAWIGHFFVEHNRPATFRHPVWSLVSDVRLFALALTGQVEAEMKRQGVIEEDGGDAPHRTRSHRTR